MAFTKARSQPGMVAGLTKTLLARLAVEEGGQPGRGDRPVGVLA